MLNNKEAERNIIFNNQDTNTINDNLLLSKNFFKEIFKAFKFPIIILIFLPLISQMLMLDYVYEYIIKPIIFLYFGFMTSFRFQKGVISSLPILIILLIASVMFLIIDPGIFLEYLIIDRHWMVYLVLLFIVGNIIGVFYFKIKNRSTLSFNQFIFGVNFEEDNLEKNKLKSFLKGLFLPLVPIIMLILMKDLHAVWLFFTVIFFINLYIIFLIKFFKKDRLAFWGLLSSIIAYPVVVILSVILWAFLDTTKKLGL